MEAKSLDHIYLLTLETEQTLLRQSKSDLGGSCKRASIMLAKKLWNKGLKSKVVFGRFDIPKAGGNGKKNQIPHYWVEIKLNNNKVIADPTYRQFCKHLPQGSVTSGKFMIPFVGNLSHYQSKAYIK